MPRTPRYDKTEQQRNAFVTPLPRTPEMRNPSRHQTQRVYQFSRMGFLAQRLQKGEQGFDCILAGRLAPKHAMVCMNKVHPARFAAKSESLESNILARQGRCKNQGTVRLRYSPIWRRCAKNPIICRVPSRPCAQCREPAKAWTAIESFKPPRTRPWNKLPRCDPNRR